MSDFVAPGGGYSSRLALGAAFTGLAGTVRFRLLDNDTVADDPVYGPSTDDIVEDPAGSGSYVFAGTAPSTAGTYSRAWDRGAGTDLIFDDDLVVTYTPTEPAQAEAFATAADLANRLGLVFTADETARAEALLADASEVIRDETGQTITLVEDDVLARRGTVDDRIVLPQRPVVSVASVVLDGSEISDWYLDGDAIVRAGSLDVGLGILDRPRYGSRGFGCEQETLTITYTHGYAETPGRIKAIALEMVARVWVNPGSVIQENEGDTGATYAPYTEPPRGLQLTNSELRSLRRRFGRRASSITIGG